MFRNFYLNSIAITFLVFITSCSSKHSDIKKKNSEKNKTEIRYAKGFDIQYFDNHTKIIIKSPYPKAKETFEYVLSQDDTYLSKHKNAIRVPVKRIVVSSTTHIPMLELLYEEKALIGFQNTKYISSERTRKRIDNGFVHDLGKEFALNTEVLFSIKPDVLVGFAMTKTNKTYSIVEQNGIPVLINNDWLEETPLGRAEWIKFFGALFSKKVQADSVFTSIETNYIKAKKLAQKSQKSIQILSGAIMQNDIWNLPAGDSYVAQFLNDANLNYLWRDSKGKGSLNLSFESVFNKAQKADFWISPAYFKTREQMLSNNEHYAKFKAFKTKNIFTPTLKTGATGGVLYYELAMVRPDLVLNDLIKITKPDLLPEYQLTFFERMK